MFLFVLVSCGKDCKVDNFTNEEFTLIPYKEFEIVLFKNTENKFLELKASKSYERKYATKLKMSSKKGETIERNITIENDSMCISFYITKDCRSSVTNVSMNECQSNSNNYGSFPSFGYSNDDSYYIESIKYYAADTTINGRNF